MAIVYEDSNIQVIHAAGHSDFAVATFNTRDERANGRDFWAKTLSEKYAIECFGFVSKAPNWYPRSSVLAAAVVLRQLNDKPLIGYGHSMGGFAALKYSRDLNFRGAVASGPQFSIDPRDVPTDKRYSGHFDETLNEAMAIKTSDLQGRLIVAYDPTFVEDRLHVAMIQQLYPSVEVLSLPYMHHRTVLALRPTTVLIPAFHAILGDGKLESVNLAAQKNRKAVTDYSIYLARALLRASKPRFALYVLDTVEGKRTKAHELEIALYRARAYVKLREIGLASAIFRKMLKWQPNHVTVQLELERVSKMIRKS
jgi:pimeloyl-ACP methyl ester carboxylesterase